MADYEQRVASLVDEGNEVDLARHIIDFDPRSPGHYLFAAAPASAEADALATDMHPDAIPWPADLAPTPQTMHPAPSPDDPLPHADALVMTYTVAEGYALADVLTPGSDTKEWTPYKNGWPAIRALIEGDRAPSLVSQRAGLWHTTKIGDKNVVAFKSDLHPATDGAKLPLKTLWKQLIAQVQPKLVITTGTAGGVQGSTLLGDVIVGHDVRWDCTKTFASAPFAHAKYASSFKASTNKLDLAQTKLMPANADHFKMDQNRGPVIWRDTSRKPAHVITTDFFAFDDAADHYGLRAYDSKARAVEMDDAALALACSEMDAPPDWISVRNASDPQMTGGNPAEETKQAGAIYEKYGYWTSIGSAVTCWALIAGL